MFRRNAKRFKVVVVPLDFGPLRHLEAHAHKRGQHISHCLGHRMQAAPWHGDARKRYIQPFAGDHGREALLFDLRPLLGIRCFQPVFRYVSGPACGPALVQVRNPGKRSQDLR